MAYAIMTEGRLKDEHWGVIGCINEAETQLCRAVRFALMQGLDEQDSSLGESVSKAVKGQFDVAVAVGQQLQDIVAVDRRFLDRCTGLLSPENVRCPELHQSIVKKELPGRLHLGWSLLLDTNNEMHLIRLAYHNTLDYLAFWNKRLLTSKQYIKEQTIMKSSTSPGKSVWSP